MYKLSWHQSWMCLGQPGSMKKDIWSNHWWFIPSQWPLICKKGCFKINIECLACFCFLTYAITAGILNLYCQHGHPLLRSDKVKSVTVIPTFQKVQHKVRYLNNNGALWYFFCGLFNVQWVITDLSHACDQLNKKIKVTCCHPKNKRKNLKSK